MKKITQEQQQNYDLDYDYNLIYPINNENEEQKSLQISQANNINELIGQQQNKSGYVLLADKNCHFEIYDLDKKEGILKFYVDQNKHGKFAYSNNVIMLLLYSDATIITTKGEIDVDKIMIRKGKYQLIFIQLYPQQEKPAEVLRSIELDFCPTHFTSGNNIIALYQKIKNGQFKLHILKLNEQNTQISQYHQILISRRCKTLSIDGNDVILITKGKKESYWFQRFSNNADGANIALSRSSSPVMTFDQKTTTTQENVQSTDQIYSTASRNSTVSNRSISGERKEIQQIQSPTEMYPIKDDQINIDFSIILSKVPLFGEQQYIQISKLEYQFRTLLFSDNSLLCGRFDTYLLMQKKRNPQNCILHSQFLQYSATEKVACSMSSNGYTVVSVDPMQMGLNVYLNYQFYKFLQSSANGKIFKEKFNDVAIVNGEIVGLGIKKLVNFGPMCNVVAQLDISHESQQQSNDKNNQVQIQSFILNKEMNQMIIQRKVDNQDQLIYCSCVDGIEIKIANIIKQDEIMLMKQTPIIEEQEKTDKNVQVSPQQAIKEFSYDNKIIQFARTTENRLNVYWREPTGQLTCGMLSLESLI